MTVGKGQKLKGVLKKLAAAAAFIACAAFLSRTSLISKDIIKAACDSIAKFNMLTAYAAVSAADAETEDRAASANSVSIELIDDKDDASKKNDDITMELSYGFQNIAKSGRMLPFYVDINNKSGSDIKGKLIIEVNGSVETDKNEFEAASVSYSFDVNAPKDKLTKVQNTISIAERNSDVRLLLVDENDNVICEKSTVVTLQQYAGTELLIGVLSSSPQRLEYFKNISIEGTRLRTRTVELDYKNMPETASGLEQLDMIIISDFDLEKLSEASAEAVKTWVENGGIILIGTGDKAEAAEAFGNGSIDDLSISEAEKRTVNMGIEYSKTNPDDAQLELDVCNVFAADGIQVMQSDDIAMLTTVPLNSGIVGIAAYDLCDISSFCTEEMDYTNDLLKALIGSSRLTQLSNAAEKSDELYRQAERLVDIADPDRLPGSVPYILFCIAYLCLMAGIYFYLRMRGLSIYYHAFVPIAAFMSAIALWLISFNLRSNGISVDYAIMRELHDGYTLDDGFIKISSSSLDKYSLSVPSEYEVHPIVQEARDALRGGEPSKRSIIGLESYEDISAAGDASIRIASSEDASQISASEMKPFAGIISEYSARADEDALADIETNIRVFGDDLSGSITNKTAYKLEDAALIMYGRLIKLGDIKAGESLELNGLSIVNYPVGDGALIADEITDMTSSYPGTSEHVRKLRRSRLLEYYLSSLLSGYFQGARLIAFADGMDIVKDISSDSRIDSHGCMLISAQTVTRSESGGRSFASCLSTEPKLVTGEYDAARNVTGGSCVLEYTLGNNISVESLRFYSLDSAFNEDNMTAFTGAIAFYNYETGGYDLMGETVYTGIDDTVLGSYLSPGNTITVRFTADETLDAAERQYLPVPYAIGRERR